METKNGRSANNKRKEVYGPEGVTKKKIKIRERGSQENRGGQNRYLCGRGKDNGDEV